MTVECYRLIVKPSRAEPSRAEPSRAEPSRAEPSRAEPSRAEPKAKLQPKARLRAHRRFFFSPPPPPSFFLAALASRVSTADAHLRRSFSGACRLGGTAKAGGGQ